VVDGFPSYEELLRRPGRFRGTAWGVYGDHDQLGSLNHLTEERVREAARLVRLGRRFNLNLSLAEFDPPLISHRGQLHHEVFGLNDFHRDDRLDNFFPQASTQIDSLRHFAHPDHGFYNGVAGDRLVAGTRELGIQNVAEAGIAGRAVLLDVARHLAADGRPIDQRLNQQISVDDLDATAASQGIAVAPGDILLLRFGWVNHYVRMGHRYEGRSCGLEQSESTAAWLWDHQISLVAADNIALEAWPADGSSLGPVLAEEQGRLARSTHTGMLHRILIPLLGIYIGELWDLDELAQFCADTRRYDIFLTAEPLNIPGGVGSPANAIAIA
jgi:kynurenine formamidase